MSSKQINQQGNMRRPFSNHYASQNQQMKQDQAAEIDPQQLIPVEGPDGQIYYVNRQWIMQNQNLFYYDGPAGGSCPSEPEYQEYPEERPRKKVQRKKTVPKKKKKKKKRRPQSCKVVKTKKRAKTANKKKRSAKTRRLELEREEMERQMAEYYYHQYETAPRPAVKSKNKKKKIKPKKKKKKTRKSGPKRIHFDEVGQVGQRFKKKPKKHYTKSPFLIS